MLINDASCGNQNIMRIHLKTLFTTHKYVNFYLYEISTIFIIPRVYLICLLKSASHFFFIPRFLSWQWFERYCFFVEYFLSKSHIVITTTTKYCMTKSLSLLRGFLFNNKKK